MNTNQNTETRSVAIVEPVGGHGGMNYYDFGLCFGLLDAGVTPVLYTCDETDVPSDASFRIKRVYQRVFGSDPAWQRGIRFLIGTVNALLNARFASIRVVHFHFFQVGILELFNVLLAKLLLLRIVITAHDVEAFRGEWKSIKSWVYSLADWIVAHNRVSQQELIRLLNVSENKISVIPHGNYLAYIDHDLPMETARARLHLPKDAKVVLFFGQIKEVKGLDLLIAAVSEVRNEIPEVLLIIAGKMWGQDFSQYQSQIDSLNLGAHCITHIRYIPDNEVANYYAAADLVILPYTRIYQSGVILMAMSYGKPVLASDLEGMKEVIEDQVNGFLFRAGDAEDLAKSLKKILTDPQGMKRAGAAGLQLMRVGYSWERIGLLTAACYINALSDVR